MRSAYLHYTFAFALAHAIPLVWSFKTWYENKRCEMMIVDKVILAGLCTLSGPVLWPCFLREDLIRLECLVRGRQAQDYLPGGSEV